MFFFFLSIWIMALIFPLWNSKTQPPLTIASWRDEGLGFGLLYCTVSLAFIHVMYWPFAIHWLGAMVWVWTLNLDHQIMSAPCHSGGECGQPVARYQVSPAENSLPSSLSVCTRDTDLQWRTGRCLEEQSITNNSSGLSYWSACCQLQRTSGSYGS